VKNIIKILILENVLSDLELILIELKKAKISFIHLHVETKKDFKKGLVEFSPNLILSGYMLRQFTNMEALKIAQEFSPLIPFIIVTGAINEKVAVECIKAGAVDYVTKEHLSRLVQAIRSALEIKAIISDKKIVEEALRESEERFKILFEQAPVGYHELDIQGRVARINRTELDMFGYTEEEMIGQYVWKFVGDEEKSQQRVLEKLKGIFPPSIGAEIVYRRKDLTTFPASVEDIILRDANDNIIGIRTTVQDISNRKKAEEEISILAQALRSINECVSITDLENKFIFMNQSFLRTYGYSENELIGQHVEIVRSQSNPSELGEQIFSRTASGGWNGEVLNKRKDGSEFPVYLSTKIIYDKDGNNLGRVGIASDITERKQSEEALRESEGIYESFINSISDMVFLKDDQFKHIVANIPLADFYGKIPAEIIGKTDFDLSPEDAAIQCHQSDLCALNSNSIIVTEEAIGDRFFETTKFPVALKNNKFGVGGIIKDVTGHKHDEEEIFMLAQSLKSINECVSITDMEDTILFVNESFLKTYGFNENELIGKNMSVVRSLNNSAELVKDILPATLSGEWKGELLNKRKDGTEFPIYLSTTIIFDKDSKPLGLIGVASDITGRKRAEKELINAKEQAELASKLKDSFIANISHEIRTPLTGILGMTGLIKDIYQSNIKKEDEVLFEGIDVSSNRIIRTIDMILNYSRLYVGEFNIKLDKINISLICANLVKEFNTTAKNKSLDLSFQNNCGDTAIFADEFSISMAISNLIDNAIKFTNKGFVKLILNKGIGDEIILEVKDTGIGIDKDYLNYLFEPYRQEQMEYGRAYEGIGLGLAIVKKVLDLNKCALNVESQKGEGTTFSIYFGKGEQPLENKSKTGTAANILPVPEELRKEVVLLVEDDLMNQVTIRRFIENRYNVIITDSSDEAREIVKKEKIDIILMDISIRGSKNGLELTKELKESKEFSHIPIIVVTAYAFVSDRKNSLDANCDSYLAKPFTKESLLNMIARYARN
jgi:PAS domain S-box-containing protein